MNRVLRATGLVVTDRRWAAALSAMALGFGLFVGVAIGPGAAGTMATGAPQIVELPAPVGSTSEVVAAEGGGGSPAPVPAGAGGGGEASLPEALPSSLPPEAEPAESPPPVETPPPSPEKEPAPPESEGPEGEEQEEGEVLGGVVLHSNPGAGSYALAIAGGGLVGVHTRTLPRPGTRLSVRTRPLENGTLAEAEKPERAGKASRAAKASFSGTVTFVDQDPASPVYSVSGRGASVLVHVVPDPAGVVPELPLLGSFVTVDVRISEPAPVAPEAAVPASEAPLNACGPGVALPPPPAPVEPPAVTLWEAEVKVGGDPATRVELAAIVTGVCPDGRTVALSSDDSREDGSDLLLAASSQIDAAGLEPGESVLATAEIGEGGALTLTGLASDERVRGADDTGAAQGDLKHRR